MLCTLYNIFCLLFAGSTQEGRQDKDRGYCLDNVIFLTVCYKVNRKIKKILIEHCHLCFMISVVTFIHEIHTQAI